MSQILAIEILLFIQVGETSYSTSLSARHPVLPERLWMLPLTARTVACHVQICQCMYTQTPPHKHAPSPAYITCAKSGVSVCCAWMQPCVSMLLKGGMQFQCCSALAKRALAVMDSTAHSSSQADSHRRADGWAQLAPCRACYVGTARFCAAPLGQITPSSADHASSWTITTAHAPLPNAISTPPTLQK